MTTFFQPSGAYASKVSGPSRSERSEYSRRYDYSGLAEHLKRQDAVSGLRASKNRAIAEGDYMSAGEAGQKIRDLVSALRINTPEASERNPVTVANPLVKVEAESYGSSSSSDSGGYEAKMPGGDAGEGDPFAIEDDFAPPPPKKGRPKIEQVDGNPNRFGNVA